MTTAALRHSSVGGDLGSYRAPLTSIHNTLRANTVAERDGEPGILSARPQSPLARSGTPPSAAASSLVSELLERRCDAIRDVTPVSLALSLQLSIVTQGLLPGLLLLLFHSPPPPPPPPSLDPIILPYLPASVSVTATEARGRHQP